MRPDVVRRSVMIRIAGAAACLAALCAGLNAQETPAQPLGQLERANYVLGPDDQIVIRASEAEEIPKDPIRIGASGFVNLPLLGRVKVSGRTTEQLEAELAEKLKE